MPARPLRRQMSEGARHRASRAVREVKEPRLHRFLGEDHIRHFVCADAGRPQALCERLAGKRPIVLEPGKTLLLHRRDQPPVDQNGGVAVMPQKSPDPDRDVLAHKLLFSPRQPITADR